MSGGPHRPWPKRAGICLRGKACRSCETLRRRSLLWAMRWRMRSGGASQEPCPPHWARCTMSLSQATRDGTSAPSHPFLAHLTCFFFAVPHESQLGSTCRRRATVRRASRATRYGPPGSGRCPSQGACRCRERNADAGSGNSWLVPWTSSRWPTESATLPCTCLGPLRGISRV
jgi:hypothetical protein